MADLVVRNLERRFGSFAAVKGIDFTARDGEFVTLLGPSGCGKSTTLWMIAGLDRPTGGSIALGEEKVADAATGRFVPAEERDFGLVFQSYALWPHMTVYQNLEFPLKLRRLNSAERKRRINESLELVELGEQAQKYPFQLSGGQQQRVALARTLVYRPRLLLLDEPLSNLDAKLRERARVWLRNLQRQLGVTTIYVTHDQSEALAMSDRVLVMRAGEIVQDAPPEDVYRRPADAFVADFIGSSNFLEGRAAQGGGVTLASGAHIPVVVSGAVVTGAPVTVGFRPERIRFTDNATSAPPGETVFLGEVEAISYLGARYQVVVACAGTVLRVETDTPPETSAVQLAIPNDAWMAFPSGVDISKVDTEAEHAD